MKKLILMAFVLGSFGSSVYAADSVPTTTAASFFAAIQAAASGSDAKPLNCVNPGGSCNGTVPCCDSYNNACFRGACRPVGN